MAVRLPADPDFIRQRKPPKRDQVMPTARVIRKPPRMPPRPLSQSRARNTVPEPLVQMTREMIRAQGFVEPRLVADFQQANGLKIDGVIGPKTMTVASRGHDRVSTPSAELSAYDPSWKDRVASALIQWGVPEQTVEGLMGSRGLGPSEKNMRVGLVDLTPAGIPFALNEAQRAWEAGNSTDAALNIAGAVPIPGAKILKPAKEAVEEAARFASKSIGLYDYPQKLQRPFIADYPDEALADEAGRLKVDIEGRPLVAPRIVGRRVVGGPDEAISPTEFDAIAKEGTGRDTQVGPQGSLLQGDLGQTLIDPQVRWLFLAHLSYRFEPGRLRSDAL